MVKQSSRQNSIKILYLEEVLIINLDTLNKLTTNYSIIEEIKIIPDNEEKTYSNPIQNSNDNY